MKVNPILDLNHKLSLGAFDEIISVSDNTYTIKRQTGYCNVGRRLMDLVFSGDKNMQFGTTGGGARWGTDYHALIPQEVQDIISNETAGSSGIVMSTPNAIIHSPIKFYLCTGNALWARGDINGISPNFVSLNAAGTTDSLIYWNFFSTTEVIIEYKTSGSYTETITIS